MTVDFFAEFLSNGKPNSGEANAHFTSSDTLSNGKDLKNVRLIFKSLSEGNLRRGNPGRKRLDYLNWITGNRESHNHESQVRTHLVVANLLNLHEQKSNPTLDLAVGCFFFFETSSSADFFSRFPFENELGEQPPSDLSASPKRP